MATALAGIGLALSATSGIVSGIQQMKQGEAAKKQAEAQAAVYRRAATRERAQSYREAAEEKRQSRILSSNLQAAAAASGAGASDISVVTLEQGIAGEGEYRSLMKMYEGEQAARDYETQANVEIKKGKAAQKAGMWSGISTIIGTLGTTTTGLYGMYSTPTTGVSKAASSGSKLVSAA